MGSAERKCPKCDFYDVNFGQCRVMPPVVQYSAVPHGEGGGRIQNERGWPNVSPDDWCGQFKTKKV